MSDELDLEGSWQDLRPLIDAASKGDSKSNLKKSLDAAYQRSNEKLLELLKEKEGQAATLSAELFAEIVGKAVAFFMEAWHEGLKEQNLAGLIEIVLEGQDLAPGEMQQFVQALPYSLLERVCKSAVSSATGIHGLMAIEYARRNRRIRSYSLSLDGPRTYVEFTDLTDRKVKFYLDESFELPEDEPV